MRKSAGCSSPAASTVGTYISGTTVEPEAVQTIYPLVAVPIEQMPANAKYVGSWPGHAERKSST